jgi:hypothetical protein
MDTPQPQPANTEANIRKAAEAIAEVLQMKQEFIRCHEFLCCTLLTETCRSLFGTLFYRQILLKTLIHRGKAGVSPIVGSDRVAANS